MKRDGELGKACRRQKDKGVWRLLGEGEMVDSDGQVSVLLEDNDDDDDGDVDGGGWKLWVLRRAKGWERKKSYKKGNKKCMKMM